MAALKLFVISDIHAGEAFGADTYIPNEPPTARPKLHPLNDLVTFVDDNGITADYLLVPGDIANRADTGGLTYAWSKIQQLARSLNARVVAAPGNHDVVSRVPSSDPRDALKRLLPTFPTGNSLQDNRFWREGYCILEEPDHRFVILDSTHDFPPHPGTFATPDDEAAFMAVLNQGGIADNTLALLESELQTMARKLNIMVLHHHPLEHQLRNHMRDWHGAMRNGGELIDLLSSNPDPGRWLVVHGHKHIPQLVQDVRTSSSGPVVFCAASLGHHLWTPVTSFINNQFHIVTVTDDRVPKVGHFSGTVATFTWGYSIGWEPAAKNSKHLPPSAGFGYITDTNELAITIREHMDDAGIPILRRFELIADFPMIEYLAPIDRERLRSALALHGLQVDHDDHGRVHEIAESVPSSGGAR